MWYLKTAAESACPMSASKGDTERLIRLEDADAAAANGIMANIAQMQPSTTRSHDGKI